MPYPDAGAAAFEAGCRGQEVGKPVKVHLVPGRKGVVVGVGASKSVREPGIYLGMPFPLRLMAPGPAVEDAGEGVGITDGKRAVNDDIAPFLIVRPRTMSR